MSAAKVLNQHVAGLNITVAETGGSVENITRMGKGDFKFGVTSPQTLYPAHNGLNEWKDKKVDNLRLLWVWAVSPVTFVVRQDSGVTSLQGLQGKQFNPSGRGTASEVMTEQIFKTIGIEPKWYRSGLDDAVDAVKNNRIVGYVKVANGFQPDATTMDIATLTPVRLLGFTAEEAKKVMEQYPYFAQIAIPASTYAGIRNIAGNDKDLIAFGTAVGMGATKDISDDLAYQIVKAIWDNRQEQETAFPTIKSVNMESNISLSNTPLHPGAIRFYKEKGLTIPAALAPPEAK